MSNDCEMFSEIRANAHLIAAAPAMYEALKALLAYEDDRPEAGTRGAEVYTMAETALAQAEGR